MCDSEIYPDTDCFGKYSDILLPSKKTTYINQLLGNI